jgi:phosphoribosylformylglycinamidine synthase
VTKVLVLRAAGTNCDRETAHAFERVGAAPETRHVNELLAEPGILRQYRILVFPGGFSYGDDIGAGRVLATELRQRALPEIERLVRDEGGLVLGICNGFQVLVKTGLLPGGPGQSVTLAHNDSHRYQDEWVYVHVPTDRSFLARGERFLFPIAHAEGKLVASDETLDRLEETRQVALRYARNPNGSLRDIAALCDATGRILGLMPHPERHLEPWHHPTWTRDGLAAEPDGLRFFRRALLAVS